MKVADPHPHVRARRLPRSSSLWFSRQAASRGQKLVLPPRVKESFRCPMEPWPLSGWTDELEAAFTTL